VPPAHPHVCFCVCFLRPSWAQTAVGSLEVELKKRGEFVEPLSVQQLLDCVRTSSSDGCKGGTPMDALAWLKSHGAATESEYPYKGVQQKCQTNLGTSGPKSTGYHNVIPQRKNHHCDDQFKYELDLMLHVKGQGPFIAYADARKWQHYANGVYPDDKCSHAFEDGNHVSAQTDG